MSAFRVEAAETAVTVFTHGHFSELVKTGEGGQATVYKAEHNIHGKVIVKVFTCPDPRYSTQEIETLLKVSCHQNIVRLLGLFHFEEGVSAMRNGYVMELMANGTLSTVIHNLSINYAQQQVYSWILQASRGIAYLHEHGILHRDINPRNMLLGDTVGILKISDFGMARKSAAVSRSLTYCIGTIHYMAPEVIEGADESYNYAADVYSLGISIWEMFHRKSPYFELDSLSPFHLCKEIIAGARPDIVLEMADEMKMLLLDSFVVPYTLRPNVKDFVTIATKLGGNVYAEASSEFLANFRETIEKISLSPSASTSSQSLLNNETKVTLLLGGQRPDPHGSSNGIVAFEHRTATWKELDLKLPYNSSGHGAVVLNGELYVFGGDYMNEAMFKLDTVNETWIRMADLPEERHRISLNSVVYKDKIYIIGGRDYGRHFRDTVFVYDPADDSWSQLKNVANTEAIATVFNDDLYIFYGKHGPSLSMEVGCYNIARELWRYWTLCFNYAVFDFNVVAYKDELVFLDRSGRAHSLRVTKGKTGSCTALPPLGSQYEAAVFTWGQSIIVAGGRERIDDDVCWSGRVKNFDGTAWAQAESMPYCLAETTTVTVEGDLAKYLVGGQDNKTLTSRPSQALATPSPGDAENPMSTLAPETKVTLLLGGCPDSYAASNQILLYNHDIKTWTQLVIKMPFDARGHGAVVLDGVLYCFGGIGYLYEMNRSMFKLDPKRKVWSRLADLPEERDCITYSSVAYRNKIYILGKNFGFKQCNTVIVYDPAWNTWSKLASVENIAAIYAAIVFNDTLYVFGNDTTFTDSYINAAYYDTELDEWTYTRFNSPALRGEFAAVAYKNDIVFVESSGIVFSVSLAEDDEGFYNELPAIGHQSAAAVFTCGETIMVAGGNLDHDRPVNGTNSVESFDGLVWTEEMCMPLALSGMATVTVEGDLANFFLSEQLRYGQEDEFVNEVDSQSVCTSSTGSHIPVFSTSDDTKMTLLLGGYRDDFEATNTILSYQHGTKTWRELDLRLPCYGSGHGAVFVNEELYVFGGFQMSEALFKLDVQNKTWIRMADLPEGRRQISRSCVAYKGKIYVMGGKDARGFRFQTTTFTYDPTTNSWSKLANIDYTLTENVAAVFNDKLYIFYADYKYIATDYYDTELDKWTHLNLQTGNLKGRIFYKAVPYKSEMIFFDDFGWAFSSSGIANESCKKLPTMKYGCTGVAVFECGDSIIVAGGHEKKEVVVSSAVDANHVESFDGEKWTEEPCLPYRIQGMTTVTVDGDLARQLQFSS